MDEDPEGGSSPAIRMPLDEPEEPPRADEENVVYEPEQRMYFPRIPSASPKPSRENEEQSVTPPVRRRKPWRDEDDEEEPLQ